MVVDDVHPLEGIVEPAVETEKCLTLCCDEEKARIVLSPTKSGISKIVIPYNVELLHKCSVKDLVAITEIQSNVELLEKLLDFAQRYKF